MSHSWGTDESSLPSGLADAARIQETSAQQMGQLHGAVVDQRAHSVRARSGQASWGGSLEGHAGSPSAQHSTDPEQAPPRRFSNE